MDQDQSIGVLPKQRGPMRPRATQSVIEASGPSGDANFDAETSEQEMLVATATSVEGEEAQRLSHQTECPCAAAQHVAVIAMLSTC